jgi:hypothetical protein
MVLMEHTDIRAAADALNGPTVLVERSAPRNGVMPPLHSYPQDVEYRVLEGELTFFVAGDVVRATAGDVISVPACVPHTFCVEFASARWRVAARVASPSRFEDFGLALARPVYDWPSDEERASVEAIAAANGIEIHGPPGCLPQP